MTVQSLEACYRVADETEYDAERSAINFAGYTAQMYRRMAKELAWACREKNSAKRALVLEKIVMEIEANNESAAEFPSRRA